MIKNKDIQMQEMIVRQLYDNNAGRETWRYEAAFDLLSRMKKEKMAHDYRLERGLRPSAKTPYCETRIDIKLPLYNITINGKDLDRTGAAISSDLKEADTPENADFNAAMDGIESMILAHYCAYVDVQQLGYLEGIATAVEACGNNL